LDPRGQRKISNYVVDASVVAKWVLPIETYQENALKLRGDQVSGKVKLFAPAFLTLEVTNALWKAVKLKRLSEEDSQEALQTLGDTNIALCELTWLETSEVLDIACAIDSAIYDAAYLFLSDRTKAQFITSDTKLYEKAKAHFSVLHLKDYI
jgi:predicted nucleic acid-binding protein